MNIDVSVFIDNKPIQVSEELQESLVSLVSNYIKAKINISLKKSIKTSVTQTVASIKGTRSLKMKEEEIEDLYRRSIIMKRQNPTMSYTVMIHKLGAEIGRSKSNIDKYLSMYKHRMEESLDKDITAVLGENVDNSYRQ